VLTSAEAADSQIQQDIAAYQAFLLTHNDPNSDSGDVFQFTVEGEGISAMERRTILDWMIAPVVAAASSVTGILLSYWLDAASGGLVVLVNGVVFAIALALFIIGTCGMIGSDDVLACFIAGNTFTWDDWFRLETQDDSLQPTIDMLLNVAVFIWFGAVAPWYEFAHNNVIPIYRLIFLGILILLVRRPPVVLGMHQYIHQIEEWRQALFVGFFGPIGVSAVFYLYISLEYLRISVVEHGQEREDALRLAETMTIVIWFLVICSIVSRTPSH